MEDHLLSRYVITDKADYTTAGSGTGINAAHPRRIVHKNHLLSIFNVIKALDLVKAAR